MIKEKYRKSSQVNAVYDYYDVSEGTGIQNFYGFSYTDASNSEIYGLGDLTDYGWSIEKQATGSGPGATIMDYDFDLKAFAMPKTIGGTAQVQICHSLSIGAAADDAIGITAIVRKWDGASETEVVTATKSFTLSGAVATTVKKIYTLRFTVPVTKYKRGETLRLTIQVSSNLSGTGSSTHAIGVDPENRDGLNIIPSTDNPRTTTRLLFKCPFRLDI